MRFASKLLLLSCCAVLPAAAQPQANDFVRIAPGEVQWKEIPGGHGAAQAELFGGQGKAGLYVVRVRFPPHWMDTPHWHSQDRYVTVIQGTWMVGTGPTFNLGKAKPMPVGSVMKHPAHGIHWDGSAGDEPVIVQITGMGPVQTVKVDPNAPQWVFVGSPRPR